MTITEFLEARIAEDEAEADYLLGREDDEANSYGDRFLAECAAKRAIGEHHTRVPDVYGDADGDTCSICTETGPHPQAWPCLTLRAIAAVYADHPDYRQDWAE